MSRTRARGVSASLLFLSLPFSFLIDVSSRICVFLLSSRSSRLMAHYATNCIGQLAKFETMIPNFLIELKTLLAPEGGKWEWLRHSYFHISSYVRVVNELICPPPPFINLVAHKSHANVKLTHSSTVLTTKRIRTFEHSTGMLL